MSEAYVSQNLPSVAMLGVGSMGGAILEGLRAPGVQVDGPVVVTTKSAASAEAYAGASDVAAYASELDPEANRKAVRGAKVVIVGVKPWMVADLLKEISADLTPGTILVSVAAGVTTATMEALVAADVSVVRAMPNTPSTVGLGVAGVAGGASASTEVVELVRDIFETVGKAIIVREDQINAVAAVSGSGPAYLFLYTEEMTAAAMRLGFDEDQARLLAQQTVIGSAELLRQSGEDPAELRRRVTSPKGTTEQAILVMQDANLGDLYDRALAANVRRSEELEAGA